MSGCQWPLAVEHGGGTGAEDGLAGVTIATFVGVLAPTPMQRILTIHHSQHALPAAIL
jgi:hypothetical protein